MTKNPNFTTIPEAEDEPEFGKPHSFKAPTENGSDSEISLRDSWWKAQP